MNTPAKPHSIFPRARRISSLVATICAILASLWAAIAWLSHLRSEYDLLRIQVNRSGLDLDAVAAQCAVDDRHTLKELQRTQRVAVELRASLEAILRVQPARAKEMPSYTDAVLALERAKALQAEDTKP